MNTTVRETVYFNVTLSSSERDGHWVAKTIETAIFGYGETREEAEAAAADANMLIVRELKQQGLAALQAFMNKYGLDYAVGVKLQPNNESFARLMRAA